MRWGGAMVLVNCACQVKVKSSKRGFKFRPEKRKAKKWIKTMREALRTGRLSPGEASKLAGRLTWGSSKIFRPVAHEVHW